MDRPRPSGVITVVDPIQWLDRERIRRRIANWIAPGEVIHIIDDGGEYVSAYHRNSVTLGSSRSQAVRGAMTAIQLEEELTGVREGKPIASAIMGLGEDADEPEGEGGDDHA